MRLLASDFRLPKPRHVEIPRHGFVRKETFPQGRKPDAGSREPL
jgi:hypothetical protein